MDPLTSIVTALVAGAVAGLKPTAEQVIKDAYAGLKALITRKYTTVSLDLLEQNPSSENRKAVVKEDLEKAAAAEDPEVLGKAKDLLEAIKSYAPATADAIGVDLQDIEAASLIIADIIATGTGVKAEKVKTSGDISITGVRAGGIGNVPLKKDEG
jgi:hypothetical protein